MKKIYSLALLLGLTFSSCNDNFLDITPIDRYSDAIVWTDEALVTAFVNNIYEGQKWGFHTVMLSSLCDESMEVWSWESQPVVQSELSPSYQGILAPNFWIMTFQNITWNSLYKNIRACNMFLENVKKYELQGEAIERLHGEVLYLRGYFYYWLLIQWGGVPLIDKTFTPEDELKVSRNTFKETVDFIVKDLDDAASLLPLSGDKARATKGAALALKSRVLLYAASDLYVSQSQWAVGYEHPELVGYVDGDQRERWENAKKAAKDVIDLGIYHLYGEGQQWATPDEAVANYVNIFLCHNSDEDIMLQYYDLVNHNSDDFQLPRVGLFNSPNGFHGWGGNTPTGQLVDSYEMSDGTKFSWSNPAQAIHPYENRDPRFYACILYDGAHWRERPDDTVDADPDGIVQTGFYQQADGSYTAGLDTRQGPIEDWNGTYTGYYMRKFLDPSVNHQYDKQLFPWRQIRYAEVLLNYAEACLELGEEEEARKYINMIRKRAGMPDIPSTETGKELMDHYRNERKIELAYEQHRYFDIRRWMIASEVIQPAQGIDIRYPYGSQDPVYSVIEVQERKWNNKAYFLPIYLDEINKNDLLIQNPGY
ncbi:RagB/SusD family nutrient uptake outer membrane protein [Phocaeicola plebeius]|uniref:RagB/SusD family nutrient uptake outer membrane protein n=1 Tax=Phocaeicola plebeius TaxID=310297 RepID=UPI00195DAC63|nr:RagB/SusD family nutrient uptake outer membrane protein [Phocaeicola plebeius]MBM6963466.1 RagB/SusD family nutrient uptake outer membrane protein [Phocaeicola plebeius]